VSGFFEAPKSAIRIWTPALAMLAASFAASGWLELRPADDRFVAAVFPPWWDTARSTAAVAAADGAVVGWGGLASIVVTRSDRGDFAARLHAAGALLLLDPSRLVSCKGGRTSTEFTGGSET
jgi:hypothetical protein